MNAKAEGKPYACTRSARSAGEHLFSFNVLLGVTF